MKNLAPQMVLACILTLMLPVAAFGQQTATIPEANIQNAGTYNDRGIAKRKKGDLDGAIADFTKAIELKPNYAEAYANRGNAKQAKGDLDGAIADSTNAIELKPDDAEAYTNRGNAKRAKGDLDGAIADSTKTIELKPD